MIQETIPEQFILDNIFYYKPEQPSKESSYYLCLNEQGLNSLQNDYKDIYPLIEEFLTTKNLSKLCRELDTIKSSLKEFSNIEVKCGEYDDYAYNHNSEAIDTTQEGIVVLKLEFFYLKKEKDYVKEIKAYAKAYNYYCSFYLKNKDKINKEKETKEEKQLLEKKKQLLLSLYYEIPEEKQTEILSLSYKDIQNFVKNFQENREKLAQKLNSDYKQQQNELIDLLIKKQDN